MKKDAFNYPQEKFHRELQVSRDKVRIMESTLSDFIEELSFVHKQSLLLNEPRGGVISEALADLLEELHFTSKQFILLQGNLEVAVQTAFAKDAGQRLR